MHRAAILPIVILLAVGCSPQDGSVSQKTQPTETPEIAPGEKTPGQTTETPAKTEPALTGFEQIDSDFTAAVETVTSRPEQMNILRDYGQKMLDYAEANPDADDAGDALYWAAARLGGSDVGSKALELLVDKDPDRDNLGALVQNMLQGFPNQKSETLMRRIIEKTSDRNIKGMTMVNLVKYFEKVEQLSPFADDPRLIQQMGQDVSDYLKQDRGDEHRAEMMGILKALIADFEDVGAVANQAKDMLFVYENLSVGAMAMEIDGEDLDGVAFKLSDYRGKVVLLDFWGDW